MEHGCLLPRSSLFLLLLSAQRKPLSGEDILGRQLPVSVRELGYHLVHISFQMDTNTSDCMLQPHSDILIKKVLTTELQ